MRKHFTKKRVVLLALVALAIGIGTGAYAYFTNSGSGTGSATVGTSGAIQITSEPPSGLLYPAGPALPIHLEYTNTGAGAQYVHEISGSVADITTGPNAGCKGEWFVIDPNPILIDYTIAAHDTAVVSDPTDGEPEHVTIRMLDSYGVQDVCKDATLTINWTSD
jgi:hypothetical protein